MMPASRDVATEVAVSSTRAKLRVSFLFVHSNERVEELALLYLLVVSCTRVGVNPVEYLADVLARIDKTADDNYVDLLPDRWKPPLKPTPVVDFDFRRYPRTPR